MVNYFFPRHMTPVSVAAAAAPAAAAASAAAAAAAAAAVAAAAAAAAACVVPCASCVQPDVCWHAQSKTLSLLQALESLNNPNDFIDW